MDDPDPSSTAWCRAGDHFVFIDLDQDRYFRLDSEREILWLSSSGEKEKPDWSQPEILSRPAQWRAPGRESEARHRGGFSVARIAQSLWAQRRVETRLASRPLLSVLTELRHVIEERSRSTLGLSKDSEAIIRAFEHARLLRSAKDRCLSRSIAMAGCLAASGDRSHVVFGITIAPFTAHCWVQQGDTVLSESLEEVQRYTPILVV